LKEALKESHLNSNQLKMRLNMKTLSTIFNSIQMQLIPLLEEEIGELSERQRDFVRIVEIIRPEKFIFSRDAGFRGRPAKSRIKLFNAFIAKSLYNLSSTSALIELLEGSSHLRRLCGWEFAKSIPSEATFSRAFAGFAQEELNQKIHSALTRKYVSEKSLLQVSYDSSAIPAREKASCSETLSPELPEQIINTAENNFSKLPVECDWGAKTDHNKHTKYWKGYKLHLAVTDGDIPLFSFLSSASLHDSRAVIPMMQSLSKDFDWVCELMDAAYDAKEIKGFSRIILKHIPLIDHNRRRGEKIEFAPHEQFIYRKRSCVERVYSNLKDNFGCRKIFVKGAAKVMTHLMFGILALTVKQLLKPFL